MGFNAISKLWLLTLVIPVLIFYFLKLKRQQVKVPSLFLWQQVLRDKRVNSPFQRFKRHILLLLQLILLFLLVLAAVEPYFFGTLHKGDRIPVLIDNSASMGALDTQGGITRLERAKEKVRKMLENKVSGQEFCLISFSDSAKKVCGFTDNSRILLDALDKIKVEDLPGNIEDALRMAQAMARNYPFDEAILLSDGNFPEKADFNLSFKLNFQKIPSGGANLGITALTAQKTNSGEWRIFTELSGTENAKTAKIELYLNGKLLGKETFTPSPDQPERVSFIVPGKQSGKLEVRIITDRFDSLASDNQAWLRLPQLRPLWIYLSPSLKSINAAMRGIDGINISSGGNSSDPILFDLLITDNSADLAKDSRVLFSAGIVPKKLHSILKIDKRRVDLVDWNREDELLRYVELKDLTILEGPVSNSKESAVSEKDIANLGYETLIFAKKAPLLLKSAWGEYTQYNLLFHPDHSTLPYRIAFPILIKNLVEIARRKAGLADLAADHTGVLPDLTLMPNTEYKITGTDGTTDRKEKTDKDGTLAGIAAFYSGKYAITANGKTVYEMGVSLLNRDESSLKGVKEISFNELAVTAEEHKAKTAKSLWKYLALLALIVLFIEWWFFNKRPGGTEVKA